ncbi:MAG: DUF86 domain-containing protein [Bacteroidales bacterium]|nr:DUF86 domain-containing protein [Bacteroidales bacterium]
MREPLRDIARIEHILECIDRLFDFTKDVTFEQYLENQMMKFAVIKNLEIIGEAAYMLTPEFKEKHSEVDWAPIVKMRHVLVHGYYQISNEVVWDVIQYDLHPLKEKIQAILDKEE